MPTLFDAWRDRGRAVEILGRRIFVVEQGRPERPWLVILHGFPTSSAGRIVPGWYFKNVVRRLWADPSRCDVEDLEAMWRSLDGQE